METIRIISNQEFNEIIKELKEKIECPPEDLSYNIIDFHIFDRLEPISHINTASGISKIVNALEEINAIDFESTVEVRDSINEATAREYARALYWYNCTLMNLQYILRDINYSDTVNKLKKLTHVNKVDIDEIIKMASDITTEISTECDMLIATFEKRNYDDSRTADAIEHLKKTIVNINNTTANLVMEIKVIKDWKEKFKNANA